MNAAIEALRTLDPTRDWDTFLAAMKVKCPWCKAAPYRPCQTDNSPLRHGDRIHPSRAARSASEGLT